VQLTAMLAFVVDPTAHGAAAQPKAGMALSRWILLSGGRANLDVLELSLLSSLQQILRDRTCKLYWMGQSKQAHNYGKV
jgi:hypothetical protein